MSPVVPANICTHCDAREATHCGACVHELYPFPANIAQYAIRELAARDPEFRTEVLRHFTRNSRRRTMPTWLGEVTA